MGDELPFFDPAKAKGPRRGPDAGEDVTGEFVAASARAAAKGVGAGAPPLTVSAMVAQIKGALAEAFPERVHVIGEVSGLKAHSSGHLYFRLKDAGAAVDAVMFRSAAGRLKFRPADGMEVVAEGRVDVYEARGQMQFYVERMTPKGAGALEVAFQQLREKLQREGLFDPAAKIAIPRYPRAIGVITSPTGAAVRDIRKILSTRWPAATVYLAPALVQGEGAADSIAAAIAMMDAAAQRLGIDTLIVGRGGGSLEDLWAFNEEAVARAIFACRTPIISGVGHEVDVTIADLVADLRAPTPTAAAEMATPDIVEVRRHVSQLSGRLQRAMADDVAAASHALRSAMRSVVFRDPLHRVRSMAQRLDELTHRLTGGLRHQLSQGRGRLESPARRLAALHPARLHERACSRIADLLGRLRWMLGARSKSDGDKLAAMSARLAAADPRHIAAAAKGHLANLASRLQWALGARSKVAGDKLAAVEGRLGAMHPRHPLSLATGRLDAIERQLKSLDYHSVLGRGFSITRGPGGQILRTTADVAPGDRIETELAEGTIASIVDGSGTPRPQAPPPAPPRVRRKRVEEDEPGLFD